jgi:type II secretory ATPase GspE/PulE/Tfp pilus assembly ATPase PilB-like protein
MTIGADAVRELAHALGLPFDDLRAVKISEAAFARLPLSEARRLGVAPVGFDGEVLMIATSRPDDFGLEQKLAVMTGAEFDYVVSAPEDIEAALKRCDDAQKVLDDVSAEFSIALVRENEGGGSETIDLESIGGEAAPIVRLVNEIVRAALAKRASDIHIHSDAGGVSVDFRVDGVLTRALGPFDPSYHSPLVSRIKVMAELDIAERRVPQDGRFKLRLRQGDVDFRVSVLPGVHGEDIVIRILDKTHLMEERKSLTLESLGFDAGERAVLDRALKAPAGMLLVTGPTGSGKTTTLYACLSGYDSGEEKIITIEDPVEYELPGILQIPVAEKKGLTFARGLRSILRHDPDKIMVGEIRDKETASIAVQAALTGHTVLTTVHANNAFDVIARFTHMEIDLFELVAALNCVSAQRLLRRLCPKCKTTKRYTSAELAALGFPEPGLSDVVWHDPVGCPACMNTGYSGRSVASEILTLTAELRQMIVDRKPIEDMRDLAMRTGMRNMRQTGVAKARAGLTSLREVARVT